MLSRRVTQLLARTVRAQASSTRAFSSNSDLVKNNALYMDNIAKLVAKGISPASHVMQAATPEAAAKCPYLAQHPHILRTAERESNARSYNRRFPISIQKAKGVFITDTLGNKYLDMLGCAGTLALGHNHPVMVDTIKEFLSLERPGQVLDFISPVKDDFITTLFGVCPPEFSKTAKIQFCGPAGTDATEAALKLAKKATGRQNIIAFQGGYHGHSNGALSLMGNNDAKAPGINLMPGVHHFPFPYDYRCPFGLGGDKGSTMAWQYLEHVLEDVESGIIKPAAVILECIQGEGGVIPANAEFMREVRRITKQHGIVMIVDEIQTGFGRTGQMLAFQHSGIVPDICLMSKAVGGGLPMAVVMYDRALENGNWQPGNHAGTFRGNQMAMATGAAALKYMVKEDLAGKANKKGDRLQKQLKELAGKVGCIGDVRGRGLMIGVEIVDKNGKKSRQGSLPGSGALAGAIQSECFKRGMIVEKGGRHGAVVRFLPPLIVSEAELDQAMGIFTEAVKAAEASKK